MNKALWAVQILLGLVFLGAGAAKLFTPEAALLADPNMGWVETTGVAIARFAGVAEILGAIGLLAPSALRIAPKLTPLAAAGLAAVMAGAIVTHLIRAEFFMVVPTGILGSLAAFVAWGRTVKAPIESRGGALA